MIAARFTFNGQRVWEIETCNFHLLGRFSAEHDARLAKPGADANRAVRQYFQPYDATDIFRRLLKLGDQIKNQFGGALLCLLIESLDIVACLILRLTKWCQVLVYHSTRAEHFMDANEQASQ